MRGRKKRTLILGILCCLLVFMGVGFAVARTTLNIGGTSTAINTWDVRIANILLKSSSDGVTTNGDLNKVLDDGTTAEINVDFIKPGDYITFEFSVENNGSIDASIGTLDVVLSSDNETDSELFDISNTFPENSKLEAGDSVIFEVTIKYKDEADKIPEGSVIFDVKFNYSQGDGNGGGNTPGGGTESEKYWDFEVDESGTIIAYNYDLGTDVVVPATNYEGKEIKTITEQSFMPKGNIDLYLDETAMKFFGIVREDNTIIIDEVNNRTAAEVVVDKTLYLLSYEECQGDSSCIAQYKAISYLCTDENTCYNYIDETKTIVPISESAELMVSIPVNPEPNISPEESIVELERNIKTLDLSKATNLTAIGESAFYYDGITSLKLGNGLITIGDSAFVGNQISGELVIPDSVTTIGYGAFAYNQINSLILGDSVTTIANNAFNSNQISGELIIPNSVTTIGASAFESNQVSNLTLGNNVTTIENSAFYGNQISGELIIPNSVTIIETNAFSSNQISGLTLGDNVITIGASAFRNNQISGELIIPNSVTSIGGSAFFSNRISSLVMDIELQIGSEAFNDNQLADSQAFIYENNKSSGKIISYGGAKRENIVIPNDATIIGYSVFRNLSIKGTLTISSNVTSIENWAFEGNEISELLLGSKLTTIGDWSFSSNLISGQLIIPNSVREIEYNAFSKNQISSLVMNHELQIGSEAFNDNQLADSQAFIYENNKVSGKIISYGGAKRENIVIPANATAVDSYAFYNLNLKGELIVPSTVTEIGDSAFRSNQISSLVMNHELQIGSRAFNDNQLSDSQAFIYENNKSSGKLISYGGAKRKNIIIPIGVIEIGNTAFGYLNINGEVVIPNTVQKIGDNAFTYNQIISLIIPNSVTSIGSGAFASQQEYDDNINYTLSSILIKRTEEDFLANVTLGSNWYDNSLNPTITYDPS